MKTGRLMRAQVQVAVLLAVVALTATGCVTMDSQGCHWGPPVGSPRILTVLWDTRVFLNPDPVHNGKPVPTLAGTLHMMGENDRFVTAHGTMVVDLYDVSNGQEPHQLERWVFDPESLKKLIVCDGWGWGYRLILPWGTYRPDISKVELRTEFDRENMAPIYSGSSTVILVQPEHPLSMPGSEPQKPPQLLVPPTPQPVPAMGIQQTSHVTMSPVNAATGSGVQPAALWTPNVAAATTTLPAAPQLSTEQIQEIVRPFQPQVQQMQQQGR